MAAWKYSMVFRYLSGIGDANPLNLKAGWTESFYQTQSPSSALTATFQQLAQYRANLLPNGSYISGLRVQPVDPSGPAQTTTVNYQGYSDVPSDIPQMAALFRLRSNLTNVRSYRMVALPDQVVITGEFVPTAIGGWQPMLNVYLGALNGAWNFRASDLTQVALPLVGISASGLVTFQSPVNIGANAKMKIRGLKDVYGMGITGGIYQFAQAVTGATTGQLKNWNGGTAYLGTATPYIIVYPQIQVDRTDFSRIVTRKVGRPTLGYRGRKGKKRRNTPIVSPAVA